MSASGPRDEVDFTRHVLLSLGATPGLRVWRQNVGCVPVRDRRGRTLRVFDAGPPVGAADVSGIVAPEGWRLELEIKMQGGKRSAAQESWSAMVRSMGGVYVLYTYDETLSVGANLMLVGAAVFAEVNSRRA